MNKLKIISGISLLVLLLSILVPVIILATTFSVEYFGSVSYGGSTVGKFQVNGQIAFCIDHRKQTPPSGTEITEEVWDNENVLKTLYYGWGGDMPYSFSNESQGIVLTTLTLDHFVNGNANRIAQDFIDYVNSMPVPNVTLNFTENNLTAYKSEDIQRTQTIQVTGNSNYNLNINLQEGVTLVNETKGTRQQGNVSINGGDYFHLEAPLSINGSWTSEPISNHKYKFQPLIYKSTNESYQRLASKYKVVVDPTSTINLSVDWLNAGSLEIMKSDSETGEKIANTTFELRNQNGEKVDTLTTNENGYAKSNDIVAGNYKLVEISANDKYIKDDTPITIEIKPGETKKIELTNLKANTKYYIFFALRNEYVSELSLPLVYTFTTGDVVSPSLKAISTGGGSRAEYTIAPGEDANTVEANVYWNLYPYSGYPDIFKQTPQDLGYTDVDPSFLNKTVSELIKSGDINKITNSAFKNQVFDTIANSETGGYTITDSGDDTDLGVSATNSDPFKKTIINTDKLELNNRYILFVTAKNILGGDPVFSIVEQIRKYDTEPPKVDSISKPSNTSANDNYFTGTVFVTFNKDLHVINQDTFEAAKYPYIVKKDDIQSTASGTSKVEFGNSGTEAKSVLKLEFKYCLPDTTVYITPTYDGITTTGVFASKDAVGRKDSPIAFRLERVANEDGTTYSWQVVMASGDYIGSTSETNPTNQ